MDRDTFTARALSACQRAVTFARDFAVQRVPDAFVLLVVPNSSHDKNLRPGEVVYPGESLPDGECLPPMNADEFVSFAWRDGLVPEWVNVHLGFIADDVSHLEVEVCGRFTRDGALCTTWKRATLRSTYLVRRCRLSSPSAGTSRGRFPGSMSIGRRAG